MRFALKRIFSHFVSYFVVVGYIAMKMKINLIHFSFFIYHIPIPKTKTQRKYFILNPKSIAYG